MLWMSTIQSGEISVRPGDVDFWQQRDWIEHEEEQHWRQWQCPFGCRIELSSMIQLEDHLRSNHNSGTTDISIPSSTKMSGSDSDLYFNLYYPLCRYICKSLQHWQSNVGRHQETASMFAFPLADWDEGVDSDDGIEGSGSYRSYPSSQAGEH
jgi:hypothetical protein